MGTSPLRLAQVLPFLLPDRGVVIGLVEWYLTDPKWYEVQFLLLD